jgi:AraC-like DNA-binding protein
VRYREYLPAHVLRQYVACYWTLSPAAVAQPLRILPDGCTDALFVFDRSSEPVAQVIGVMSAALMTRPAINAEMLGVRFRPGEGFAFLKEPARELRDQTVDLSALWDRSVESWVEEVSELGTAERLGRLEQMLLGRLSAAFPPDPRVRRAIERFERQEGQVRVAVIARELGLSERQLERRFQERVGLGPKAFARVARFQALSRALQQDPRAAWADRAAGFGYVDQAHLVHDVRAFAGVTPRELARLVSDFSNTPLGPLGM